MFGRSRRSAPPSPPPARPSAPMPVARVGDLEIRLNPAIELVPERDWNALIGADDPFLEHAFLEAMEASDSVGPGSGWEPAHVTVHDGERLVAAAPLYAKGHSYGEYIFDWGWASAASRAGVPYYPKLVNAVPFTPATGRRLLTEDGSSEGALVDALALGMRAIADAIDASSIHSLFLTEPERESLATRHDFLPRLTYQFHWTNAGYGCFDDFLARLRSKDRKEIRRERRKAAESGLELRTVAGPDLGDREWRALDRFYRDTAARKGAMAYLEPGFLPRIRERCPHLVVATLASRGDEPVAGALGFRKGAQVFGRYWGCVEDLEMLHFELCYYRFIELAIDEGLERFEAGAQGQHKVKRGLMPSPTLSAHWVRHPGLREALVEHLPREAEMTRHEMDYFASHGPFRRGE